MFMTYAKIKLNFDRGFWTKEMVAWGVIAKAISEEEYKEITGDQEYKDPRIKEDIKQQ